MSAIDVTALLQPVSDTSPSGEDLEYDPAFSEMEQAAQGKPEQQYGDTIIPAEPPDWKQVKRLALDMLGRSKDFRVAVSLARATLVVDSLDEFADALGLIAGYVESFWPTVHPQLDEDDDNDPTIRVNTIGILNDFGSTIRLLRETPIVRSRRMGKYSYRDVLIAQGDLSPPPEMEIKPDMGSIEGAFMECELADLRREREAVGRALTNSRDLASFVTTEVGAADSVSLRELDAQLKQIETFLVDQLAKRGSGDETASDDDATDETSTAGSDPADAGAPSAVAPATRKLTGDITTREDVIRALDKICGYYERFEPSSPVPLLLKRAKRLATMSFLDILRDLTPDGVSQAVAIGGMGGSPSESSYDDSYSDDSDDSDDIHPDLSDL